MYASLRPLPEPGYEYDLARGIFLAEYDYGFLELYGLFRFSSDCWYPAIN